MNQVVTRISERLLGEIDRQEPDLADEYMENMKRAVRSFHKKEGWPKGKVKFGGARGNKEDWLDQVVKQNKQILGAIPKFPPKENRKAVPDS